MRGGEGIVDIDIAERGECIDEGFAVLFFPGVEAGVFEEQEIAVAQRRDRLARLLADAIRGKSHRLAEPCFEFSDNRSERIFVLTALGPAEMREDDDLRALGGNLLQIREDAVDARRIRHFRAVHRHVEIDADQDPFAGKLGVVQNWKRREWRCPCHPSFPIATAVSAIRFEKPHSLSYQDTTRTSVPSMTRVWSTWKMDECGS